MSGVDVEMVFEGLIPLGPLGGSKAFVFDPLDGVISRRLLALDGGRGDCREDACSHNEHNCTLICVRLNLSILNTHGT